ncbi:hypothetical protein LCGC14_2086730 [marine sediment metagenome]|uniref:Uncharacterized protein n=1 Tax=marine sediment metagenome TaxID=412755 RepID=A0A0F9EDX5_9ZZZZ
MREHTQEPGGTVSGSRLNLPAIKKRCETLTEEERKAYAVCLKYSLDVPAAEVVPILESLSEARRERVAAVTALEEAQMALRALSWQEPDGTRHWCEFAARGESDIAVNDCNCDEGRAILGENQ